MPLWSAIEVRHLASACVRVCVCVCLCVSVFVCLSVCLSVFVHRASISSQHPLILHCVRHRHHAVGWAESTGIPCTCHVLPSQRVGATPAWLGACFNTVSFNPGCGAGTSWTTLLLPWMHGWATTCSPSVSTAHSRDRPACSSPTTSSKQKQPTSWSSWRTGESSTREHTNRCLPRVLYSGSCCKLRQTATPTSKAMARQRHLVVKKLAARATPAVPAPPLMRHKRRVAMGAPHQLRQLTTWSCSER